MQFQLWLHDGHEHYVIREPITPKTPSVNGEVIKVIYKATKSNQIRIHLHNTGGQGKIIVEKVIVRLQRKLFW